MTRKSVHSLTLMFFLTLLAATAANAEWSSDPAANLALADRPDEQAVPKLAATSDGGAYAGWYDHSSGNYDLYLQRLDPAGFELWGHNGMLVSDYRQDTWVMEWHLIADSTDSAVMVFADLRAGKTYSINAYRVGPGGEMLWGPSGITLSSAKPTELCAGARVAQASDGDFVFIWTQWVTGRSGSLKMQRVSPEGVVRFAAGGLTLVKTNGTAPAFPDLVPSENGSMIVAWLTDNLLDSTKKFLLARKFGVDGGSLWPRAVSVFDACSLPVAYKPEIRSDGAGGALLAWHYTPWLVYSAAIQHLNASGAELFPHNGVTVAVDPDINHYYPAMAPDPLTGDVYVFFREYDSTYGLYGVTGQRFSPQGVRLWGDDGKVLVPLSSTEIYPPVAMPAAGGAEVFWMKRLSWTEVSILGARVDSSGDMLWGCDPVVVSSCLGAKDDLQLVDDPFGQAILVWGDERNVAVTGKDIYGQNVNADGTLGN